ncbi:hypothetical protein [Vibrio phage CKB-S2]|nr:hypothetical protein [Vibrio phage CKB-S2]
MLSLAIDRLKLHNSFKIMFIGGKRDGEVKEVQKIPPTVRMLPVIDQANYKPAEPENYNRIDLMLEVKHQLTNTVAVIYAHEGLSNEDVLNLILTRYAQGANNANN